MIEIKIRDPYGFIYITTNLINGIRYIGQKKFDGASRWKSYLGSGYFLLKAIKKYGRDSFARNIVAIAYSSDELNQLEKEWIDVYDAVNSDDYYNRIEGGIHDHIPHGWNSTPVICINNGKQFDSISDASLWSGYVSKTIKDSFKKKNINNERFIFRPLKAKLNKDEICCCVCGRKLKKKNNKHKYCKRCVDSRRKASKLNYINKKSSDKSKSLQPNKIKGS